MIKRKPSEWVEIIGIEVIDSDGWAMGTWETPITAREFIERCDESTIRYFNKEGLDCDKYGRPFDRHRNVDA